MLLYLDDKFMKTVRNVTRNYSEICKQISLMRLHHLSIKKSVVKQSYDFRSPVLQIILFI